MAALNEHAAAFASAATIAVHADQRAAYRVVSVRASALHAHGLNRHVS